MWTLLKASLAFTEAAAYWKDFLALCTNTTDSTKKTKSKSYNCFISLEVKQNLCIKMAWKTSWEHPLSKNILHTRNVYYRDRCRCYILHRLLSLPVIWAYLMITSIAFSQFRMVQPAQQQTLENIISRQYFKVHVGYLLDSVTISGY